MWFQRAPVWVPPGKRDASSTIGMPTGRKPPALIEERDAAGGEQGDGNESMESVWLP